MGSNVKSTLWLCNLVIPEMAARGDGAVVIDSSIAGIRGTGELCAYGISKAADFALARNLAVEWGPKNVRVNCIAPGLVKTDFAKALWEDPANLAARNAQTPLRRIGEPHEIGPVAAFLASPAASFITGQVIVADGGVTIA
jgi:NAD(P)-dependent dehydrogenase (short-subunit alcohol dehydrogenase family)